MQILLRFGLVLLIFTASVGLAIAGNNNKTKNFDKKETVKTNKQILVEEVDIQGNRRLKDQDLLYYIKTRPGDTYSAKQVERDMKELLSFNWFDKAESRVFYRTGGSWRR